MAQTERTQVVVKIVAWCRTIPGCVVRKRHGSAYGTGGDPDIYGCIQGWHFEIEAKVPGKQATARQQVRMREWRAGGACAGVAHDVLEAQHIVAPLLIRLALSAYLYPGVRAQWAPMMQDPPRMTVALAEVLAPILMVPERVCSS